MSRPRIGVPVDLEVKILLWNVWNLPSWLTDNKSKTRAKLISGLLNAYDIIVLNEAFVNHTALFSEIRHSHRYVPARPYFKIFSSGIAFISRYPITNNKYEVYAQRQGVDWFTGKGIAHITVDIKRDSVDYGFLCVVASHMQASDSHGAQKARRSQALQAAEYVQKLRFKQSLEGVDAPIILMGDLNMGPALGGAESSFSQHYSNLEDARARTTSYEYLVSRTSLQDVSSFYRPERDADEYVREICRVLIDDTVDASRYNLAYELQEYTDGAHRLSDTKALCLRMQFQAIIQAVDVNMSIDR